MERYVILEDVQDITDMGLWAGALDRWNTATDEQKEAVYQKLCDCELANGETPIYETTINDFIWFECDDIFFPNESEE